MKIFVDIGKSIDVFAVYKDRGFKLMPPIVTLSGSDIIHLSESEMSRYLYSEDLKRNVHMNEAVILHDGMKFFTVPLATM